MMEQRTVTIDGAALRKEFERRNIALINASKELGYGKSWLNMVISSNRIVKPAIKLISVTFGIDPEVYVIKEESKVKVQPTEETALVEVVQHVGITEKDAEILHKVIYTAVYEAVKKALNE